MVKRSLTTNLTAVAGSLHPPQQREKDLHEVLCKHRLMMMMTDQNIFKRPVVCYCVRVPAAVAKACRFSDRSCQGCPTNFVEPSDDADLFIGRLDFST
jgi:hypothetical protein